MEFPNKIYEAQSFLAQKLFIITHEKFRNKSLNFVLLKKTRKNLSFGIRHNCIDLVTCD